VLCCEPCHLFDENGQRDMLRVQAGGRPPAEEKNAMPLRLGVTRCAVCHETIDVVDVYACPACETPPSYFHTACIGKVGWKCVVCGEAVGEAHKVYVDSDAEEPGEAAAEAAEPEDDDSGYEAEHEDEDDEGSTVVEAAELGRVGDVPLVVDVDQLVDFLRAAPAPEHWAYQGWGKGGYVLAWTGVSDVLDPTGQPCAVRFHVHPNVRASGGYTWDFGAAWVSGTEAQLTINAKLGSSGDATRLEAVVNSFWDEIQATIKHRRATRLRWR
jgi:hypothetical protein